MNDTGLSCGHTCTVSAAFVISCIALSEYLLYTVLVSAAFSQIPHFEGKFEVPCIWLKYYSYGICKHWISTNSIHHLKSVKSIF